MMFTVIDSKTILLFVLPELTFNVNDTEDVIFKTLCSNNHVKQALQTCEKDMLKAIVYIQRITVDVDDLIDDKYKDCLGLFLEFEKSSDLIYFKISQ